MFLHVQNTKTLKMDNPFFLNVFFFHQMCTIPKVIHGWGTKKECLIEKGLQNTILDFQNV
jgi:hypothetical protein